MWDQGAGAFQEDVRRPLIGGFAQPCRRLFYFTDSIELIPNVSFLDVRVGKARIGQFLFVEAFEFVTITLLTIKGRLFLPLPAEVLSSSDGSGVFCGVDCKVFFALLKSNRRTRRPDVAFARQRPGNRQFAADDFESFSFVLGNLFVELQRPFQNQKPANLDKRLIRLRLEVPIGIE